MKKLLLAAGILVLSTASFGVTGDSGEASVPVRARVVKPLKVEKIRDLDLGIVLVEDTKVTMKETGLVKVTGTPNANVKIEIEGNSFTEKKLTEIPLTLSSGENKMEVAVSLENKSTTDVATDVFSLGGAGTLPLEFTGKITTAAKIEGAYEGTLKVRAKYNN